MKEVLQSIISSQERPNLAELIERLLPVKQNVSYHVKEIDLRLEATRDAIEEYQQESNCKFDQVLDHDVVNRFENLNRKVQEIQLGVMNFQCNLTYTKEQCEAIELTAENSIVQERNDMLLKGEQLNRELQQIKFESVRQFYDKFSKHLNNVVINKRRICASTTPNHLQLFDWTQFQHTMFLLKACGKAIRDIGIFERLYQSDINISHIRLKQPIDQIDFDNYIEFQETYSIEFQLDISIESAAPRTLTDLMHDPDLWLILEGKRIENYDAFGEPYSLINSVTIDCCKLLIELNMNYIEAHYTEGINIDKLNGGENIALGLQELEQALPSYAFAPQEYITQIGQHLLTLRKQSEQFDDNDSGPLKYAFEFLDYAQDINIDVKSCKSVTEIVMRCISRHCIRSLLGRTRNSILSKLTLNGKRQLATDALYLDNVLEDLKLLDHKEPNFSKFKNLLTL